MKNKVVEQGSEGKVVISERLNYTVTGDGKYVGSLSNIPGCIVQADSLEELKVEAKTSMKVMLAILNGLYNEPFECVEQTHAEFLGLDVPTVKSHSKQKHVQWRDDNNQGTLVEYIDTLLEKHEIVSMIVFKYYEHIGIPKVVLLIIKLR